MQVGGRCCGLSAGFARPLSLPLLVRGCTWQQTPPGGRLCAGLGGPAGPSAQGWALAPGLFCFSVFPVTENDSRGPVGPVRPSHGSSGGTLRSGGRSVSLGIISLRIMRPSDGSGLRCLRKLMSETDRLWDMQRPNPGREQLQNLFELRSVLPGTKSASFRVRGFCFVR